MGVRIRKCHVAGVLPDNRFVRVKPFGIRVDPFTGESASEGVIRSNDKLVCPTCQFVFVADMESGRGYELCGVTPNSKYNPGRHPLHEKVLLAVIRCGKCRKNSSHELTQDEYATVVCHCEFVGAVVESADSSTQVAA